MTAIIVIAVIFILVIVGVVAIGIRRDEAQKVRVEDLPPEFALNGEEEARMVDRDPEYHWSKMFAPKSGRLDDAARLKLINDVALVRAAWCVPILQQPTKKNAIPICAGRHEKPLPPAKPRCHDKRASSPSPSKGKSKSPICSVTLSPLQRVSRRRAHRPKGRIR